MKTFKAPLVVGYKGEIGSFLLQGLLKIMPKASNIWCYDINETEEEKRERIKKADVIFLCIPMWDTMQWFYEYASLLKNKTVIEQCSLKSFIYEDKEKFFEKNKDIRLLSMHILFRPSVTPNSKDRTVAFIKHTRWRKMRYEIEQITEAKTIWFKNYKQHDKAMAVQQALVHRILLVLDDIVRDGNQQSYVGKKVLELTNRIKDGDPVLYKIIQDNKYLPPVLKEFDKKLSKFQFRR